jgi:sulfur carrier protein
LNVSVNGERREVPEGCTLDALLARLALPADTQASAVNGEFVPRPARGERVLRDGDEVTLFKAIVGG